MLTLTFEQARAVVEREVCAARQPLETESVPLAGAQGRVLAEPAAADRDCPPFDRATRDGYAVRAAETPGSLRVAGQVRAGEEFRGALRPGEAIEIMTGAPVPAGADAVVMVEYSQREGDVVALERGARAGENIVPRGSEAPQGLVALEPGHRLRFPEIALLAGFGCAEVRVYRRPRVAILSTGDEVVEITATPRNCQIRNSNAHSLAAQVSRAGGEPAVLPIAPDDRVRTRELIERGLAADLLLLSGGVSMGKYDLVEQALADLGAEFFFDGVLIRPGKPLVFGRAREKFFFGLPGNPLSTMVTFEVFARATIELLGRVADVSLRFLHARLGADFRHKPGLTRFLPAMLSGCRDEVTVVPVKWQGSGDVGALTRSNCLLVAAAGREEWKAGEWMPVLPL
ncbi:MAG TPA: gephyrin-like molybdotransferase Glp [Bryobacterales bacterium]|nr:gephyrin-like molybdotransferase Glp [Bryobacterales bacterium]